MASFIKLDSTNLVQNGYNNTWRYEFAGSSVNFVDTQMAIQSVSLYVSDFNIDSLAFAVFFKLAVICKLAKIKRFFCLIFFF